MEERTGSAFRSKFLRGLIFAAAAAGDGFVVQKVKRRRDVPSPDPEDRANNERDVEDKWVGSIPGLTRVTHDTTTRLISKEKKGRFFSPRKRHYPWIQPGFSEIMFPPAK